MSNAPTATAGDGELVEPPRLNYVLTVTLILHDPIVFPSHRGTRCIVQLAAGKCTLKGPNGIEGKLMHGCDYLTIGVDGSVHIDVRNVWEMDNGSKLYQTVNGISLRDDNDPTSSGITCGTDFETMDEKYKYLNNAFLFGIGQKKGSEITIHYYTPVQP
eukprot:CAMPEP_0116078292 /NCGR_PEP_ID=MMETSP0327-20121206/527_1 /TAXON_ID=44447 /ORGANISM="Pseudo-nitzschia delicatissima, Strain B596" /LENGTH=158 /DNA_ID=CAMNT_0003568833 /DNA_START=83 /DNA_END=559 /DNA_ORIENTATION=+